MNKNWKKGMACILSTALLISFAGCTKEEASTDDVSYLENASYPIQTETMLTYWMPLSANVSASATEMGDTHYAEEMEKRTGVTVKYIHPVAGQETEQLNLLLASDELPDMIEYNWYEFTGGPNKAINEEYIITLNDLIDKYSPNLKKLLSENPEFDKAIKTDEGKYYVYPFIKADNLLHSTAGLSIRKDWLDEYGLKVPETFDELYDVLKVLKEKKNLSAPLTIPGGSTNSYFDILMTHFGASNMFYVEDGTVKYGPLESEYKDAIATLAKFYKDGLLDRNFSTADTKIVESNMLNEKSAATHTSAGGQLGKWVGAKKAENEPFGLEGIKYLTKEKGGINKFGGAAKIYVGAGSVAITSTSANKELAAKYLDYLYGEEGHMLANFGTEGVSYEMKDGKPIYTDLVMKSPDGLAVNQAMGKYFRSSYSGPFLQDVGYIEQYYQMDCQKNAQKMWSTGVETATKYELPNIIPTQEESTRVAKILSNVDTYKYSMLLKFIMGTESLDNYDAFIKQLKDFEIEQAISIYQTAYERYQKR